MEVTTAENIGTGCCYTVICREGLVEFAFNTDFRLPLGETGQQLLDESRFLRLISIAEDGKTQFS